MAGRTGVLVAALVTVVSSTVLAGVCCHARSPYDLTGSFC